jgi:hypothetical protein
VRSTEITPAMLERAEQAKVSRAALQAALDATAAELQVEGLDPAAAREALAKTGSEGFRALCVLLELGHHHYRTAELLARTRAPGDEKLLLALAERDDLPNFASWSVLEALGTADTPEVRAYLHARLADEDDAGQFMAASMGLARLRDQTAVAAIANRLLERREGWSGVAPYLVTALRTIGGAEAKKALAEYEQGGKGERGR